MHLERRQNDMNPVTLLVDAMEAAVRRGVTARNMIAVIGKLFAWRQSRGLTDNLVALDDQSGAIGMEHDPLSTEQGHAAIG